MHAQQPHRLRLRVERRDDAGGEVGADLRYARRQWGDAVGSQADARRLRRQLIGSALASRGSGFVTPDASPESRTASSERRLRHGNSTKRKNTLTAAIDTISVSGTLVRKTASGSRTPASHSRPRTIFAIGQWSR